MTEHDRWRQRQRAVGDREIAVAHAAGRELDHHLVRAGRVDHDVFDPHRGGVAPIDHCLGSPRAAPTAGRAAPAPRESSAADAAHDRPGAAAGGARRITEAAAAAAAAAHGGAGAGRAR